MAKLTIGTDLALRSLDERYRAVLATQHDRIVAKLGALTDEQWQSPSRNSGWTVQQTMQHVAGIRIENARVFDGLDRTWSADFDPHRSPQEDIDTRSDESPAQTLTGFVTANDRCLAHLATRSDSDERTPMLWGALADFRLFFLHLLWDSVVHERDIFVPLGIDPDLDAETRRFVTAYALLIAGVAVMMGGGEITITLQIDDLGRADLSVEGDAIVVSIDGDANGGPNRCADAGSLIDAMSGRGEVGDVIEAPEDVVGALSGFAVFLRG